MFFRRLLLIVAAFACVAARPSAAESLADYPVEYRRALVEMVKAFNARDFDATLAAIEKADKMVPPTTHTLNTRAAIAVERKQWDEGAKLCRQALKLDPRYYPARFNLAEIPLMQGKYPEARAAFEKLLDENPHDELVQFRIFLTHLLEKNDSAAREILGKIKFPSDTAAFYYANAAWEFAHGNDAEGKAWVARGLWVFGPEKVSNFSESLVQLGWIERPVIEAKTASRAEPAKPAAEKLAEDKLKGSSDFKPTDPNLVPK